MKPSYTLACISGLFCLTSIQTANADLKWLIRGGIDLGGDELAHAYFTNGNDDKINAGEMLSVAAGGIYSTTPFTQPGLETEVAIGWKFDTISGKNGNINWNRYPLEVLEFYRTGTWRFGGGLTYHMNPKLTSDGVAASLGTVSFDDALGVIGEIDYLTDTGLMIGGRVTLIDYKARNQTANGNSIGVSVGYRF
ncbi:MAG: hypothetical protein HY272_04075 [Gammaproteobacteria bacterium]|nr:hypothetical protein [Gammaproteobacteria bacterium]